MPITPVLTNFTTPTLQVNSSTSVTMTSLELVDYINAQRDLNDTGELRHRDFLAKVPKVLGEGGSEKFRGVYIHPLNGQTCPIFHFPKREACLMAMSYSYDLQAKVYDYMTALEAKIPSSALPNFADPAAAARAWADQFEKAEQAAIANQQLADALTLADEKHGSFKDDRGCGKTYATINELAKATGTRYGFWALKKWCEENEVHRKEVFLTPDTFTYAYPTKAWADVHGVDLNKVFGEKV